MKTRTTSHTDQHELGLKLPTAPTPKQNPCPIRVKSSPTFASVAKTIPPSSLRPSEVHFTIPVVKIPQPDGSVLVKAGQPQETVAEIRTTEFAKQVGCSDRTALSWIERGIIKGARRISPIAGSPYMIPVTEIDRIKQLQKQDLL